MRAPDRVPIAIALCLLAACAATSVALEVPAMIVGPDAQSAAELHSAVSKALDRTSVALAGDALTQESVLTIEPVRLRDPRGNLAQARAQGREMRMPEQFRLVKSGDRCILVHERTAQRFELVRTKCAAKP